MASVVMMKRDNPLKPIHNTIDHSKQRVKDKGDGKPSPRPRVSAPKSQKVAAPKPQAVPQPVKEEVKEVKVEEGLSEKIARVRRIYSREFLVKFKYSAPAFPPGVLTPSDLIAQYNKDYELRLSALREQQQQESTVTEAPAAPTQAHPTSIPQNKDGAAMKERKTEKRKAEAGGEKTFKLRISGADESILRSPMFRGSSTASAAPSKRPAKRPAPSTPALIDDKENGSTNALPAPVRPTSTKRSESVGKAPRRPSPAPAVPSQQPPAPPKKEKKATVAPTPVATPSIPAPAPVVAPTPAPAPIPAPVEPAKVEPTPAPTKQVEMQDAPQVKEDLADVDALAKQLKTILKENDPRRLAQRQKQIDYGKATSGYAQYTDAVAKSKRKREDPKTPNKHQVCSKRSWDGQIRKWRRMLHFYDPPELQGKGMEDLGLEGDDEEVNEADVAAEELALNQ
jgi:hypothetical protein